MIVSGKFEGNVRDVSVESNSRLLVDSICFSQVNNLNIGEKCTLHSLNSWNLSVNGSYANSGELACGGDFHLHLNNLPSAGQSGNVVARGKLTYSYVLNDRPKNWEKLPRITEDPTCLNFLRQYNENNLPQDLLDKLEKEFYKRCGFDPKFEENQSTLFALRAPGRLISRIRTITTYTDHYLNTITYHYVTTTDEFGGSHTYLDHISETGYIWTGRTSSTHTEEIPHAQVLDKTYDVLKEEMDRAKRWNNNQLRLAQMLAEQAEKQRAAEMNKRFLEALRKALLGLDPEDPDVRAILENDYIKNLLSSLQAPVKQSLSDLLKERALDLVTETAELALIGDFRAINDFARGNIDFTTTVERFFKQADIDLMVGATITALTNYFTGGSLGGYAIPETLAVAKASKFLRKDFPDLCSTFFSKKAGKNTGLNKAPRIQATRMDADKYLQGLKDRDVLSKKGVTKDGYEFYKFIRKCEYRGIKFKKDEYISRDTLHHEWEWFQDPKTHKGAIDPIKGNRYKSPVKGRTLKLP